MITALKIMKFIETSRRKPFSMIGVFLIYGLNIFSLYRLLASVSYSEKLPAIVVTVIVAIVEWKLLVVPAIHWLKFQAGRNQ